ncbi:preprotein translocase, SecY subunit [Aciduliprofundum sp. MAR08-339]|nr:preprotein translocase, SecY subunit [Aciduliprofundum sp. MAR08-339]
MSEEIPRKKGLALPVIISWIVFAYLYFSIVGWKLLSIQDMWNIVTKQWVSFLIFSLWSVPLFYLGYLVISYNGDKSKLYGLKPVLEYLPMIRKPKGHVQFKHKLMWTFITLLIYFSLTNIYIYGLDKAKTIDLFASFRAIMAGASGSLVHLGIGPIVTASIIMQLFVGAKIFNIDLTNDEDKAIYQSTQKLLVIIMIFVEAIPQVFGYLQPSNTFVKGLNAFAPGYGMFLAQLIIVLQLFFGSYLVFLMDEVVSKWGIGSGISLFIAAGVSEAIFTGIVSWIPPQPNSPLSLNNPPSGTIPKTIYILTHSSAAQLYGGRIESILFAPPNPIIALIGTTIIFLLVAYVQSVKIELPLAHERARGARGRYPIKLMYSSNIPVILTSALLANVAMWSILFWTNPTLSHVPILGHNPWIGAYPTAQQAAEWGIKTTTPIGGIAYYLNRIRGLNYWLLPLINPQAYHYVFTYQTYWMLVGNVVIFTSFMIGMSIIFAKFWIETANMNAKAIAKQIQSSGMQIPGFRRSPAVLEKILNKYIPAVTIFSGAAVGALAAFADLIGTVGNTSGTGVLLTVGILIQLYEAMGREQLMEMHPVIRQFFE